MERGKVTILILFSVCLIALLVINKASHPRSIENFPSNSTVKDSVRELTDADYKNLTVYETLPDYDYSGPTLQIIFLDSNKKPIRNFKGNLTLQDRVEGSSPGSVSNYNFDSCRFALVESDPNNRAILAGGSYSLSTRVNGRSQFLPGGIKIPSIKQGVKDYAIIVDLGGLLKGEVEADKDK